MSDQSILRSLGVRPQRDALGVATPRPLETVRAWCQRESGERPQAHQSHGICPRHLAAMKADLDAQRRIAA